MGKNQNSPKSKQSSSNVKPAKQNMGDDEIKIEMDQLFKIIELMPKFKIGLHKKWAEDESFINSRQTKNGQAWQSYSDFEIRADYTKYVWQLTDPLYKQIVKEIENKFRTQVSRQVHLQFNLTIPN